MPKIPTVPQAENASERGWFPQMVTVPNWNFEIPWLEACRNSWKNFQDFLFLEFSDGLHPEVLVLEHSHVVNVLERSSFSLFHITEKQKNLSANPQI